MAASELTPLIVEQYTQGRLKKEDEETARLLASALSTARRYCGWHVTPVITDDVHVIDGPGTSVLKLPTFHLVAITALTENGDTVDVSQLRYSPAGRVRKAHGFSCWTRELGGIEVTMTHGYDEGAEDWQAAVLSLIGRWADETGDGRPTVVGPVQWPQKPAAGLAFTERERAILDMYALSVRP